MNSKKKQWPTVGVLLSASKMPSASKIEQERKEVDRLAIVQQDVQRPVSDAFGFPAGYQNARNCIGIPISRSDGVVSNVEDKHEKTRGAAFTHNYN